MRLEKTVARSRFTGMMSPRYSSSAARPSTATTEGPGATGAQEVTGHRLRGAHGDPRRMRAGHLVDGARLRRVVVRGAGAVGIHVADLVGPHAGVGERERHALRGALPLRRRLRHVVRVA